MSTLTKFSLVYFSQNTTFRKPYKSIYLSGETWITQSNYQDPVAGCYKTSYSY